MPWNTLNMKNRFRINHWSVLFIAANLLYIFILWMVDSSSAKSAGLLISLFTVSSVATGFFIERYRLNKFFKTLRSFIENPDTNNTQRLLDFIDHPYKKDLLSLTSKMLQKDEQISKTKHELLNYQEIIELWAHEIKTPLSLAALLVDNKKQEMSPFVHERISYIQQNISENVERILFYARLQADHVDYNFETLRLDETVLDVLDDFQSGALEKRIHYELNLQPLFVLSDKRALNFILSQVMSNAVKYAATQDGKIAIEISYVKEGNKDKEDIHNGICLTILNNGTFVLKEDMPFLFEKGFTGSIADRKQSTGLGLYLVKKYADLLNIDVKVITNIPKDYTFGIKIVFPLHEQGDIT